MARLIPQKQIEEINQFPDSISVGNSVFISGSLLVSQSIDIGNDLRTKQRITGSVEITGSLTIDGPLNFRDAESRLNATASFADISVDTQKFGGIPVAEFGGSDSTIYVSATRGDDSNDGRSPQFPVRTIKRAAQIVTPGDDGRYGLPTGSNFTGFRIDVQAGTYLEDNPIELPRNTTVWGAGLRVSKVIAKNENEDLFWVNSGCYLAEMTFGGLRVFPSVDDSQKGFAISFAPNAFITTSPYIQNCSMISNQENSFLEKYEEIPAGGGGLNVDGNRIHPDSPLASMVLDAYTQVAPNGVGCQVVGRGFIQLVSFFTNFSAYSVKVIDGGQAVLLNSNTSFGDFGMYASGSRFITGSGGNTEAFLNVQDNYSIIVDTIERGLDEIPDLVPNTRDGIKVTSELQYFSSSNATSQDAKAVVSDYRLIANLIERGVEDKLPILAISSDRGYNSGSVWNISGDTQITASITASNEDASQIADNFDIVLDIIERGNAATSSYIQKSNVSESIYITDVTQYKSSPVSDYTEELIAERFDTIISIVENGVGFIPEVKLNTSQSFKRGDVDQYISDLSSSLNVRNIVSESLSIVYNILDNGTGSAPTIELSSSIENPLIDYQNAYTLLIENIPFIQEETILYLSSSWSEFEYNQKTCKRDIGYIISGAAHDLLYGGNEESVRSGNFYYLYPSDATTTQKDPTLTAIKYATGLVDNLLSDATFVDTTAENDNAYELLFNNKRFIQSESIAYVSASWSTFEYNEAKCVRDLGYIIDAVATDILYGGNERSVTAGNFYYKYPSQATINNSTAGGQLNQTIDAIKYAKRLATKLVKNETFVTQSSDTLTIANLIKDNRSLIQDETITYINTTYPNFTYNQAKCRRDTGYILDSVRTDLIYGGNERSELSGLYYYLYPSIANTTQLEETLEGIRYAKGFTQEIIQSRLIEQPSLASNTQKRIKVGQIEYITSSVSGTEFEARQVSSSIGIVEDIIRFGNDSILGAIAANSEEFEWRISKPVSVSTLTQTLSSVTESVNIQTINDNFGVVTDIISGGPSIIPSVTSSWENTIKVTDTPQYVSGSSVATSTEASSISESISLVSHIVQSGIKTFTPTTATYNPSNGDFVMTIPNHTLGTSDSIYLKPESFTFTCEMDGNRTEHKLPGVGQPAYTNRLSINSKTSDTITVNVGKSGPNVEFNPTNASYDPATGDFVITVASHSLSVGEGIVLSPESFSFTCDMDDNQSTKSYPRVGIDPYAVRSLPITAVTETTMTVNVGASGPNKYFTPSAASYDASTGDMVVTVGQHGLGVGRSVVLEDYSFAFTCDQDGDTTTHSYPRPGSDPYAGKSIIITSVGTTSHTITDAPYDSATGDVTITIASHGFSNGDYIKLDDNSLTYTCVLDGNVTEKSYPRAGYDYPSGRWLEISNVTTNTFDINIGSSPYVGAHTFISATSNGLKRQDGTFTINVGDAGSASSSVHTFVSASVNAVKHEPQSVHTFVSASNGAVKHLPQSTHTFVRTESDSVTTMPVLVENTDSLIKVGSVTQNLDYSGSLTEATKVSSSFATITNIVENGVGVIPTIVSNTNENIKFFNDSVQYISSSFSGSLEDVSFISSSISYVTSIIANGTGSYTASEYPSQPLSSSNAIAAYQILRNNIDFIKDETIAYLSSSWSTASYDESKCRRDVGLIISGAAEDLIWGTVSSSIVNGRFYYDYPSQAQGAQLNQTLDGIFFASEVAQKLIQNIEFVTASIERRGAWNAITENEDFIKEEMIQYLSSSWSTFDYNERTCRRDAGYILDAVKTDIYYGGNERSAIAGNFYYLYPSAAILSGSASPTPTTQLVPTLDGLRYAGRITEAVVTGSSFSFPSQAKLDAKNVLLNNKQFVQDETIAYLSSSWSEFSYNQTTCKRDIGFIIDAAVTDVVYGGNERSRIAANFYYRYPSAAIVGGVPSATQQKDPTVDGIKFAGGVSEKVVLGTTFTSADSNKITLKNSIIDNKENVQQNVIDYINETYPKLNYNNDKCYRDVGFIIDAVVTDLVYGGNGRSVQAGSFYYRFPSQATYSQLTETIDGINFARDLIKLTAKGANSVEDSFDTVIKIIESGSSIVTEETIGTGSAPVPESLIGDPISTIGIPKDSYGDGLVQTVVGTSIPTFNLVENTEAGIQFGNDTQITGSITASSTEVSKVSESFSDIIDIIRYGTSGSLTLSGSYDTSTYYEVITPESGDYYIINTAQLNKFDSVTAGGYFNPAENTGSFADGIKDPTLTLKRGEMYTFSVNPLKYDANPFYIKTARKADKEALYNEGVTNNGVNFGTLTFIVPLEAPDRLYYVNGNNVSASGIINVVDNLPLSDTQRYIETPSKGFVEIITNNVDGIKISNIEQYNSVYTASSDESHEISSSFATTIDILKNGVDNLPTITKNIEGLITKSGLTTYTSSTDATDGIKNRVTSSFDIVLDIIENGIDSLPTLVENTTDFIKVSSTTQITSSFSASLYEVGLVSSSFGLVISTLKGGLDTLPVVVSNTSASIKVTDSVQYISSSASGSLEDIQFISESVATVYYIIGNGTSSYETAGNYVTPSTNESTIAAYQIIRNNIPFIQAETLAYLSSSWTTASYNEASCSRDIGLIISGAAEDLIWNSVSASIVNGKFYFEYPSQAEKAQLKQTLDGVEYASRLAQSLVQNIEFVNASSEASASHHLLLDNKEFIQNETIAYISSSWSGFDYSEILCRRDIGHIIDAAATDTLYGGNERSVQASSFYFNNPSAATGSQLNQTVDAINYARRLAENIIVNNQFATAPFSRTNGKDLLFNNKEFIAKEVTEYISSSWADFEYNDVTCRRDVGYIVDAVVTDLVYGGNERSIEAGKFYYLYPSDATGSQLNQTLDGVKYAKELSIKLLENKTFTTASYETSEIASVILQNKELIKEETIQFLSSSWSTFEYNEAKCRRDTGYIIDAVVTDFVYGGNQRSVTAGQFYYLYPSDATGSQLVQTVDGITYAQRLTNKLINNVNLVTASLERRATKDLLLDNKALIQNEVIHFISSSWSTFEYIESKCKRDVGYIIDAIATDVLYGGNERSVVAGEFYYRYPSQATTTQLDQTITGVKHAAGLADKIIQNTLLISTDSDKLETYNRIRNNREFIQSEVIEFIDNLYPYFTYNRVKCRRDVGFILDAVATDLLWGGNERSIIAGDYYYRFPSQATTFQLDQTIDGIEYAKALTKQVILNNELERPRLILNSENHIKVDGVPQYSGSMAISGSYLTEISSSFEIINNVILGGLNNLPTEHKGIESLTKVTNSIQITNSATQSVSDISSSFAIVIDVIQNGVGNIPTIVSNTNNNIKVGNIEQYISSSASGSLENVNFISSSIDIVTDIITNGVGGYVPTNYTTPSTDESTIAAYQILRNNIDFIQEETIAYLSSSWSGFVYDESKCRRDVGLIVSGAAEDLIWNTDSSSIVNGKFYLEYPSQATSSQLDQTLDGIFYASNLAQKLIQNVTFSSADSTIIDSYNSIVNQKATIQSKVIAYLSSSFPTHQYNESKCSRDVGYIIDGVATDLLYGGNERSVKSGNYYYKYPSQATGYQLEETVAGIEYAQRLTEVASQNKGTQIGIISASIDMINDIIRLGSDDIPFTIAKHFQTSELDTPQQLTTSSYVFVAGDYNVESEKAIVSSSFLLINDIIENTTSSIDGFVDNAFNKRKFSDSTQYESLVTASAVELVKVYNSFGIVADIVENGLSQKPTIVRNNIGTSPIKVTDTPQYISSSAADKLQSKIVSSSIAIVADIIENGSGSAPAIIEYTTPSDSPKAKLAYQLLRNNIGFIQSETIAYLSSSWSNFNYNEASCSRDVGLIVSGAAEDLIWNSNSASIVNGKFYLEYPSAATGSQLQQTLDGIRYANTLADHIIRNRTFVTASSEVSASYHLLMENREFLQNETIAYISSSWSGFSYDEVTCKRDVGYIVDAVATDLLYGGNQRSVTAGDFYYRYPSSAIVGGVPSSTQQKDPTVTGINYAKSVALELLSGSTFVTTSNEVEYVYDTIRNNRAFIQAETVAFVNAKYPNLEYNEASCSRDTGFIVDAVATDLRWGGNQRSIVAGQYYYKFPSEATTAQLGETTDAVIYASKLVTELIDKNTLQIPTYTSNVSNIKVTNTPQYISSSASGSLEDISFISSSVDIVSTIIAEGSGSYLTASNYVSPSTDESTIAAYQIIRNNIDFIKGETIAYLSSSWSGFVYNEASCSRDVGLIISGAAEDLIWNTDSASIVNGKFYLEYPSAATGSQLDQTLDGIFYASRLAQKLVQNVEFVYPSTASQQSYNLMRDNKGFIQSESIAYLSSSWSDFPYDEVTCKRDIGYIIDAISTDILYGGNERSVIAGNYYYKYPSSATNAQLDPTVTGIEYAGDMMEKVIVNQIFQSPSAERIAGNESLLNNRTFIQSESLAYLTASWSTFEYNKDKCARDVGYIVDAVATDLLYGGNERSRTAGEYYYLYPSEATTTQANQTTDGVKYAGRIAEALVQNIQFVTASLEVSASFDLLRKNKPFIAEEVIQYVSSSWSGVYYNESKCRRDTGFIVDAAATDLLYGGNERSVIAGNYYFRYPSSATERGVPSAVSQLDPTTTGVKYASGLAQNVIQNVEFYEPSASVLVAGDLLTLNKTFIQKETIAFLSSSWSEFPYNEASCSRDLGYIIDAIRTDLVYGGNERSIQAATFYYYIPSVAITEQKPQTIDGIDFAKGISEKCVLQDQLVFAGLNRRNGYNDLRAAKKYLQSSAISYTDAAFPGFVYNQEKCYRDTGFILDAISTDLLYGGNERSIEAAKSYYNGVYGDASVVVNEQKKETAEANRYLRTLFQKVARNAPLERFGSLIITTGHDFSYAGSGVTYKALPPNQGGNGVPDPTKEIVELGGGRVYFTAGNELGDFKIGTGLVINQATGTLQGRTFSRSLFSLVTPFSLALEG